MSHFAEQVHITIDEFTQNIVYYDLKLTQTMMDHHHFSFTWQYTASPVIKPADQAAALRKYEGREVIFTFKSQSGIRLMSKGIITKLKSVDVDGSPLGLHVTGISHTILLDDLKKSRIFSDRSLKEIAINIFAEETAGEFYQRDSIEPTFTKIFDLKTQYNETSFEFLKRLSARHGQWFYFDGMRIQLGQTKTSKVKLINRSSLHNFCIETNLVSHKASFAGYDYNSAAGIRKSAVATNTGSADSFSRVVLDRQASVSQPDLNIASYTNQAKNADEISEMVKLKTAGKDANSVYYSGTSYLPIGVGQVFSIENQTVEHELIAIEVIHHSEVHGNYTCEFKAIPADVTAPHYTDVETFRKAETQSALIKDNNDPEKLGRVKVAFYWAGGNTESEWIRVKQQYAGEARGSYYTPEIGDEVLVDFEGGNIECPYVSGSHYNGKAKPEFFDPKNMIKGFKFRFGQLLKFVEKTGIWLSDPSGNELHLDEESKNMNLTSTETITFNCKNFIVNASEGITYNAGTNIAETAVINKSTNIGGFLNTNVTGDNFLYVAGNYDANIEGHFSSDHKKDHNIISNGSIISNSDESHEINSKKDIKNNSGEDTKHN
ncbi:type IV secretion protein Rhs [Flavobacterium psychroterrae]|uniref:Type IV secretion protein Rhs n=1 Tax=Flavobacterium psychroterrae TaxID=2133767 RepID=A0ABS5P8E4_9FLAO|nr:phage baseplate assembly protein V [Flavobacterium psychroterrae]MBS7230534.1 type IV secretion protein Rhs [Flavobacterium psychroterrae]